MPQARAIQLAKQTVAQLQAILGQANLQHPAAACLAATQQWNMEQWQQANAAVQPIPNCMTAPH